MAGGNGGSGECRSELNLLIRAPKHARTLTQSEDIGQEFHETRSADGECPLADPASVSFWEGTELIVKTTSNGAEMLQLITIVSFIVNGTMMENFDVLARNRRKLGIDRVPRCREVPVLTASASRGEGLEDLWETIRRLASQNA